MAKRVVVTGMGIVSCIGNELGDVGTALREGRSGITRAAEFADLGFASQVAGIPSLQGEPTVDRSIRRYMGDQALFAYHAMRRAIDDAAVSRSVVCSPRTGIVVGSGTGSLQHYAHAVELLRERGCHRITPYLAPRVMASTASACLATAFGMRGVSYTVSSACASSAHALAQAYELVQSGRQDVVFAGGAEEVGWATALLFDTMGALSTAFNDRPGSASRPYDAARDGFVLSGGAGIIVVESDEHAAARGARVRAELAGYGTSSDGLDMVLPDPHGAAAAMRDAALTLGAPIDYVNTHATSTRQGDVAEVQALREIFGGALPAFSSTKGLTGHSLGACGAHELVFCLLMMEGGFVAGSPTVERLDAAFDGLPLVRSVRAARIDAALSNSFGFGGANVSLALRRVPD